MDLLSFFREAVVDRDNGATVIEGRLIRNLLENRRSWSPKDLREGARMIQGFSAMANLRNLAACIEGTNDLMLLEHHVFGRLQTLEVLPRLLAEAGRNMVMPTKVIITISRSSAVEAVLFGAFNQGWRGRVAVLDGTPSGGGAIQAERLGKLGFEVRSLPDGAINECLGQPSEHLLVLIGADAVGPRRMINAQGTGLLLEKALQQGIKRVAVADSGKNVGEGVIDDLIKAGRIHQEEGPGRNWPVFEAYSRALVGERISEAAVGVTTEIDPLPPKTF